MAARNLRKCMKQRQNMSMRHVMTVIMNIPMCIVMGQGTNVHTVTKKEAGTNTVTTKDTNMHTATKNMSTVTKGMNIHTAITTAACMR